jgi:hypothetical protein
VRDLLNLGQVKRHGLEPAQETGIEHGGAALDWRVWMGGHRKVLLV